MENTCYKQRDTECKEFLHQSKSAFLFHSVDFEMPLHALNPDTRPWVRRGEAAWERRMAVGRGCADSYCAWSQLCGAPSQAHSV